MTKTMSEIFLKLPNLHMKEEVKKKFGLVFLTEPVLNGYIDVYLKEYKERILIIKDYDFYIPRIILTLDQKVNSMYNCILPSIMLWRKIEHEELIHELKTFRDLIERFIKKYEKS